MDYSLTTLQTCDQWKKAEQREINKQRNRNIKAGQRENNNLKSAETEKKNKKKKKREGNKHIERVQMSGQDRKARCPEYLIAIF